MAAPSLLDEPLASAWLTERAVPVAMFHNVAGKWQRQAVEHAGSQPQADRAMADTPDVDIALLGKALDELLDGSQLDDIQLKLRRDGRGGRLAVAAGLCHLDLAEPLPAGESASPAAKLDTARSASHAETQGYRG